MPPITPTVNTHPMSLDVGLSEVVYQRKEAIEEVLPERKEIAPPDEVVRNNLLEVLSKPNLAYYVLSQLRPHFTDRDILQPARFNKALRSLIQALEELDVMDRSSISVLQRASLALRDESELRDLVLAYRSALYQG